MADLETSASRFLHVFAGERLQAFSDAVYAIIATLMALSNILATLEILQPGAFGTLKNNSSLSGSIQLLFTFPFWCVMCFVIPLKIDEDVVKEEGLYSFDLGGFLFNQWPRYLIYLYSFTLVVDTWYTHSGVFSMAEQVDDVLIWLNLLSLLLVSFLPYGTGLVSSFPIYDTPNATQGELAAVTICSANLVLLGIVMLLILLHLFRQWQLVHPNIQERTQQGKSIWKAAVISVLISPCMALLACGLSFVPKFPYIGLLFFYGIGIVSLLARTAIFYYYRRKNIVAGSKSVFESIVSKSRTEAFADGLFSIVATLIVLDLTTDGIPKQDDVINIYGGNLFKALYAQRFVFSSYILSFIVVGLLWFVHYGMMHFIKKLTPLLSAINIWTMFLVGVIPFISEINTLFSDTPLIGEISGANANKIISIRALCIIIFLIGMGQLLFWTTAIWFKQYCMSSDVDRHLHESLQFCKILVFPTISFITFWGTFSETFLYYRIYDLLLFSSPFLFLILKGIFRKAVCFSLLMLLLLLNRNLYSIKRYVLNYIRARNFKKH